MFEPGHGWRLFDVTTIIRSSAGDERDGFGALLGFADGATSEENQASQTFHGTVLKPWQAPFHPALLVVEAGDVTD